MQDFGVISFLFCVIAMMMLFWQQPFYGEVCFIISLIIMVIKLLISSTEIFKYKQSLKIELDRTNVRKLWEK